MDLHVQNFFLRSLSHQGQGSPCKVVYPVDINAECIFQIVPERKLIESVIRGS